MLVPDGLAQGTMYLHTSSEERLFCRCSLPWHFSSSFPAPHFITHVKPIACLLKSWFKIGSRWKSDTCGATRVTTLRQMKLKMCWWGSEEQLDSRLALWTASLMRTHMDRPPVQHTWRTSVDAIHTQANLGMLHTHTSCLEMSAFVSPLKCLEWRCRGSHLQTQVFIIRLSARMRASGWAHHQMSGDTPDIKYF